MQRYDVETEGRDTRHGIAVFNGESVQITRASEFCFPSVRFMRTRRGHSAFHDIPIRDFILLRLAVPSRLRNSATSGNFPAAFIQTETESVEGTLPDVWPYARLHHWTVLSRTKQGKAVETIYRRDLSRLEDEVSAKKRGNFFKTSRPKKNEIVRNIRKSEIHESGSEIIWKLIATGFD